MLVTKKYLDLLAMWLLAQLIFIFWAQSLSAQTNFFPLGIYSYDVYCAEHTVNQPNEMPLIDGLHINYFSEMTIEAQPGIIEFFKGRGG